MMPLILVQGSQNNERQRLMLTFGWEFEASILSPVNAKTKIGKTWLSANLPSLKLAFVSAWLYFLDFLWILSAIKDRCNCDKILFLPINDFVVAFDQISKFFWVVV